MQAAIGIPLGWAMAFAGRQELQSVLYGVKAGNPWVLAGTSGIVALVALIAALRPALVAARVDPMVALRYESRGAGNSARSRLFSRLGRLKGGCGQD